MEFPKNDNVRCRAVCSHKGYGWVCLCSFINEMKGFLVKTFYDDQNSSRQVKNRLANIK